MTAARFFTDEDVFGDVAVGLRKNGFDAVSTPEVGRLTEDDESHLQWAAHEGRVLVTFNVGDFVKLHGDWLRSGKPHAGIIVSEQRPVGEILRRLLRLAEFSRLEGAASGGEQWIDATRSECGMSSRTGSIQFLRRNQIDKC